MLIIFALFGSFVTIEGGSADPETGQGLSHTFQIGRYEVGDVLPTLFTFDQAVSYVNDLNAREGYSGYNNGRSAGQKYVIPTRNEWYRAAYWHSGWMFSPHGNRFPTGTYAHGLPEANYIDNPHAYLDRLRGSVAPIGSYSPSPNGLYDMAGNVWEWNEEGVVSGGDYNSERVDFSRYSSAQNRQIAGLRVAIVPECSTILMMIVGMTLLGTIVRGIK